jgi:hypothetical protein
MPASPPLVRPTDYREREQMTFLWARGTIVVELVLRGGASLGFARWTAGKVSYLSKYDGTYVPVGWLKPYATTGALRLPSGAKKYGTIDDLAEQIRTFIHRYFDCDPVFESVAVLYVLMTWVYESFQAVPYLRFLGLSGTGKSRALETIGSVTYRPLVVSGATTPAPLYRLIETIGGTLLLDEADYTNSQIGSDIIKVLNCGYQQGFPVIRAEKNRHGDFIPRLYQVYGPKIIAGRRSFRDDATENRCLTHHPTPAARTDIPSQLPRVFEEEALYIRNQALKWRFDMLDEVEAREVSLPGLSGRSRQLVLPLISIMSLMQEQDRGRYEQDLLEFMKGREQDAESIRRETIEAKLLEAYSSHRGDRAPICKDIRDKVVCQEEDSDLNIGKWLTPRRAGDILRGMGFKTRHTNRGSELSIAPGRLKVLIRRYGIVTDASPKQSLDDDQRDDVVTDKDDIATASKPMTLEELHELK